MFKNSSIFVLAADSHSNDIFRIDIDNDTQRLICKSFFTATSSLINQKEKIIFDGSYKPNEDELLVIENFQIIDKIKDAVRNPLGINAYQNVNGKFPKIKAIFVGERYETENSESFRIAFQRFKKEQYISTKSYNLFFNKDTFFRQSNFGISITDSIDCFYDNNELFFISYFFAQQIFDLKNYYRSATDKEVNSFVNNKNLKIQDSNAFQKMADTWIRRKIAMINDSKVLENYSASDIAKQAENIGVNISIDDNKIILPSDKKQIKVILGFLDEEAYKGPFTQNTYLTNSKRQLTKK